MSKRLPVVRRSFDASAYWGRFGGEKLCGERLSGAPTYMKSAGTKKCTLCMRERMALFYHFGKKKSRTKHLMNSRKEMHGKCTCKTRFIRLRSIENEGADETTS
jgi:hypothetical protein